MRRDRRSSVEARRSSTPVRPRRWSGRPPASGPGRHDRRGAHRRERFMQRPPSCLWPTAPRRGPVPGPGPCAPRRAGPTGSSVRCGTRPPGPPFGPASAAPRHGRRAVGHRATRRGQGRPVRDRSGSGAAWCPGGPGRGSVSAPSRTDARRAAGGRWPRACGAAGAPPDTPGVPRPGDSGRAGRARNPAGRSEDGRKVTLPRTRAAARGPRGGRSVPQSALCVRCSPTSPRAECPKPSGRCSRDIGPGRAVEAHRVGVRLHHRVGPHGAVTPARARPTVHSPRARPTHRPVARRPGPARGTASPVGGPRGPSPGPPAGAGHRCPMSSMR